MAMVKQGETDFVATCFRDLSWGRHEFYSVGWREMTGNRGLCHPKSIPLLTKHPKQPWFSAGCIHSGVTRGLFLRGRWHESCLRAWDSIPMSGWWITYIYASLIVELPSFCWPNPQKIVGEISIFAGYTTICLGEIHIFWLLKSPSATNVPGNGWTMGDFNPSTSDRER